MPLPLVAAFKDLLWPRACLGCGAPALDGVMCLSCRRRSKRAPTSIVYDDDDRIRPALALWKFEYDAPVRRVLHRLKYGNCPWIGYNLGRTVAQCFADLPEDRWDFILPVPLHPLRLLERGYNQSDWIAHGLGDALGVPVLASELRRIRNTTTQTDLARAERHANVDGAFSLSRKSRLEETRVILVDDTLTTGATLGTVARILLHAGAEIVQPAAVARATLWLEEEQPEAGSVIPSRTEESFYGTSGVGYNL